MKMNALELRVPPLALTAAAAGAMVLLPAAGPQFSPVLAWGAATALMSVGAGIALLGVLAFRQAKTTVDPRRPERSANIVRTGVYARTRNPMYVGFVALLLGLAVGLQSLPGLMLTALVVMYLHHFQIRPEERLLRGRFGEEFDAYCKAVPRWL